MLFRAIITHRLPAGLPPIWSARASRLGSRGSGPGDTHRMTTHPTCCCSDWRRRLPGTPTSPGTWCPWSWCTDHQGQTWEDSRESMSECSGGLSSPPEAVPAPCPWVTLSFQSPTPWWLGFLPLNNSGQPGQGAGQQKGKRNCWRVINNDGVSYNQMLLWEALRSSTKVNWTSQTPHERKVARKRTAWGPLSGWGSLAFHLYFWDPN